jgi:predicted porin
MLQIQKGLITLGGNRMRNIYVRAIVIAVVVVAYILFKPAPAEAADINIYGDINYKLSNDENAQGKSYMKAENNSSKVGINISEGIGEGITGFGQLELGVDTDDSNNNPFDSRLALVGLIFGTIGSLSAGRQSSPFTDNVSGHTDVFEVYGSSADQNLFARDTNTIAYSNTIGSITFDGLAKIDGSTGENGVDVQEGTVTYQVEGVKVSGGISNDNVNDINYYGLGFTTDASSIGLPLTVGYTYTLKDAATDVTGNEIVGSYSVSNSLTVTGGYGEIENGSSFYTAGASSSVTESLSTYVEFQREDKTGSSIDTDSYSAGLKFTF